MNSTAEHIKLIDGIFEPPEAADVLLSLINYKIKFHTVQSLNLRSGYTENTTDSEQRIAQLKKAKETIKDLVVKARNENLEISIDGDIVIQLNERKPNP